MSQKLSEWVRSANLYRVLAPTMVDIMFQHAVIENLDVTDADTSNTIGLADMKLESNRFLFQTICSQLAVEECWH